MGDQPHRIDPICIYSFEQHRSGYRIDQTDGTCNNHNGRKVQTLVTSGTIANSSRVDIGAHMSGIATEVLACESQFVTEGQPLILLDDRESRTSFTQIVASVGQSKMQLPMI